MIISNKIKKINKNCDGRNKENKRNTKGVSNFQDGYNTTP